MIAKLDVEVLNILLCFSFLYSKSVKSVERRVKSGGKRA